MLCHKDGSHGSVAKGHGGGGGGNIASPPLPPNRQTSQTPTPNLTEAAAEPAIRSAPTEPATGSADNRTRTPKLFGSPDRPVNSKGHWGPLWMSLEDIHVTMGVRRVKGCCVLHVCVLIREGFSILKVQT